MRQGVQHAAVADAAEGEKRTLALAWIFSNRSGRSAGFDVVGGSLMKCAWRRPSEAAGEFMPAGCFGLAAESLIVLVTGNTALICLVPEELEKRATTCLAVVVDRAEGAGGSIAVSRSEASPWPWRRTRSISRIPPSGLPATSTTGDEDLENGAPDAVGGLAPTWA